MISLVAAVAVALSADASGDGEVEEPSFVFVPPPANAADRSKYIHAYATHVEYSVEMQDVGTGHKCYCGWTDMNFIDRVTGDERKGIIQGYFDICDQEAYTGGPTQDQLDKTWGLRSVNNNSAFCKANLNSAARAGTENDPYLSEAEAVQRCAAEPSCMGFQRTAATNSNKRKADFKTEKHATAFYSFQPTGYETDCVKSDNEADILLSPSQCFRKQAIKAVAMKEIKQAVGFSGKDVYVPPSEDDEALKIDSVFIYVFAAFGLVGIAGALVMLAFPRAKSIFGISNAGNHMHTLL